MSGMFSEPPMDAMGALILEIREDVDVATLVSGRVRGGEPAPGDSGWTTDPDGRRKFAHAFVVVSVLDDTPDPRIPVRFATFGLACYGTTYQNASAVYLAVAKAIHQVGPRVKSPSGLGIYRTAVISGGAQDKDPDTQQPVVRATISLIATTQAVAS